MQVNHLNNPLGSAMERCVFHWKVAGAKGKRQTASRIVVASDKAMKQVLTDTGFDGNADSLGTEAAVALAPRKRHPFFEKDIRPSKEVAAARLYVCGLGLYGIYFTLGDGSEEVIGTDEGWTVRRSKITFSNLYDGEQMDETLAELPAEKPVPCEPPKGKLTERMSTSVTVHETFTPVELIRTPAGELLQ